MKFILSSLIALTAFLSINSSAEAGPFRRGGMLRGGRCGAAVCAVPAVCAPVVAVQNAVVTEVITPVVVPVYVPTFQFQYQPACVPQQVACAGYGGYPVTGAYGTAGAYGSPMGQQQQQMQPTYGQNPEQSQMRLLARALLEEINRMQGEGGTDDDGPPMVKPSYSQPSPPPYQPGLPPQPQTRQLPAGSPPHVSILYNRCQVCHTGATAKGGLMMFGQDGRFNPSVDRQKIVQMLDADLMPPQATTNPQFRLSATEKATIRAWAFRA